ncbi:MAG: hypothetical protein KC646_17910 [Candidatus Cloacimonetes bacterium]|nr:hypothetical protein [Candidatus Cloacimonadota bacterium]
MKLLLILSFLFVFSSNSQDFFDDLKSSDSPLEDETVVSDGGGFKSKLLEIAKDRFSKGPSLFNFDSIHGDIVPDVGVFIGSKTVNRWSSRFLTMVDSPVRNIEYTFEDEELGINLTIDLNYFMDKKEIDFLSPVLKPGEIFTKYRQDQTVTRSENTNSKRDSSYFIEVGMKLRFPLLGNQELNTVHLGFRKTYFKTYYKSDYNLYLQKQMKLASLMFNDSDGSSLEAAKAVVKKLMAKLEQGDDLTSEDQRAYKKASAIIDGQESESSGASDKEVLEEEITSFESGSIMPFKLSSLLIKDIINYLNKNKVLSDYLDVEVLHYDETSAGLVKVSGLNRLIETALPGLNIFFVGTRNDSMTGDDKIYIAGRLYE